MSSKPVAFLRADLGVTKTYSRPHAEESAGVPGSLRLRSGQSAFCQGFFRWYDGEHRHSSLGLLTPGMVPYGQASFILKQRQQVLDAAYQLHPERFVRKAPRPQSVPEEVWINRPTSLMAHQLETGSGVQT